MGRMREAVLGTGQEARGLLPGGASIVGGDRFGVSRAADEVHGALGGGGGADDQALVSSQGLGPPLDVAGLEGVAGRIAHASEGAQEGGAELGDQLLDGIPFELGSFGHAKAVQPFRMAAGMTKFMVEHTVVGLRRPPRSRTG